MSLSVADVQEHADDGISLLLTDVVMPLMGGAELASQIKDSSSPDMLVIYTAAREIWLPDDAAERGVFGVAAP